MSISFLVALCFGLVLMIGGLALIAWALIDLRKAQAPSSMYDEWRHALAKPDYVQDRRNAGDL